VPSRSPAASALQAIRRAGGSLFVRIFALVLATLAVAQIINVALLAALGSPPATTIALSEVAAAVGDPGTRFVQARIDRPLPFDPRDGNAARLIARTLAGRLGMPADAVTINLDPQQNGKIVHLVRPDETRQGEPLEPALIGHFVLSTRAADGGWLVTEPRDRNPFETWQRRFLLLFLIAAALMLPFAWVFARRLADPFRQLAAAAEAAGRDPAHPPPNISGPVEVQRAAHSFADMQRRLRAYVEDRTKMVGAIAHDLRTPLTRLAFRLENIDPVLREPMARDVAEMEAMVAAAMAFVRGAEEPRQRERLELGSLVERIADDLALTGRAATADVHDRLVVLGDPVGLSRLFTNLMENSLKYGGTVHADARREGRTAIVTVCDEGPGLSPAEIERVFEPFYRAERSRSRETGGIGLGLSVARSVARAHGGDVTLANREHGGLVATVSLPLDPTVLK
jgi:signal transduction histidine kinase